LYGWGEHLMRWKNKNRIIRHRVLVLVEGKN
jgi:hypothetical protein